MPSFRDDEVRGFPRTGCLALDFYSTPPCDQTLSGWQPSISGFCNLQLAERFECDRKVLTPKTEEAASGQARPHQKRGPSTFETRCRPTVSIFIWSTKFTCQVIWMCQNFKTTITSQRALKRAPPVRLEKSFSSFCLQHFHLKPSGWL